MEQKQSSLEEIDEDGETETSAESGEFEFELKVTEKITEMPDHDQAEREVNIGKEDGLEKTAELEKEDETENQNPGTLKQLEEERHKEEGTEEDMKEEKDSEVSRGGAEGEKIGNEIKIDKNTTENIMTSELPHCTEELEVLRTDNIKIEEE